jgi:CHAT domain-containing protein
MPEASKPSLLLSAVATETGDTLPLPGLLAATTRSGTAQVDPLLANLRVDKQYSLAAPHRGELAGQPTTPAGDALLALETEDGATLFIRADALAEAVARLRPEAVTRAGAVDFAGFSATGATRGGGEVLWKTVSELALSDDELVEAAKKKALEWAKEKFGDQVTETTYDLASTLGAKALMWVIEARLAGRPGLYRWQGETLAPTDHCGPDDPRLKEAVAAGHPILVLIHGTASHSQGSFSDLRANADAWNKLARRFPGGIYGYEHRTFSESPAENALALLQALPAGARISLVSHSRGGLVGDLLCLGDVGNDAIDSYEIDSDGIADQQGLARVARDERDRLRAIRDLLNRKHVVVERYVRVACPARGTRLLSDNLDLALSILLNAIQWGGGALVGAVAGTLGGPVAAERFGQGASSALGVLKRLALEIAKRRLDPRLVPGIEAMRTDSPLAAFLARPDTPRRSGIDMAAIAGDTEMGFFDISWRRVANLFCDWALFDRNDNDLVVDTDSMVRGLGQRPGAKYLHDQDDTVTHFRYFVNDLTRDALRDWLTEDAPLALPQFQPIVDTEPLPWRDRAGGARRDAGPRPAAIVIPGIMGTHIEIDRKQPDRAGSGKRIWFEFPRLREGQFARIAAAAPNQAYPDDIFEMFYGKLADHLAASHDVSRCPYDWRLPLTDAADILKQKIEEAAARNPGQPIRLLAHSMGGLVVRVLMHVHPAAWRMVLDSGGRLLMLGTPNNGSHLMVQALLGKNDSVRMLATIDKRHKLQDIVAIVAGFPGALALLPRPDFVDADAKPHLASGAYYTAGTWDSLKKQNVDRWFGDGIGGQPTQNLLDAAGQWWSGLPRTIANPERVAYVFGQADKTPCGVRADAGGRLELHVTPDGDGSVTWASGRLENLDEETRCWYMPVAHADLTGEPDYFPAIVELLSAGMTDKLGRLPRKRGEPARSIVLEAGPPVQPGMDELARAFLGGGSRRRPAVRARSTLRVSARADDVRFLDQPVLCGHYIGDAISGAEAVLDRKLGGALSERERLGIYAHEIGSQAIVLRPPNAMEAKRNSLPGAVIVGLGSYTGQLSTQEIGATVRAAVMRFLLHLRDQHGNAPDRQVKLYSLLIGWNSTASIGIAESVAAVTRGVLEANRAFQDCTGGMHSDGTRVDELCFVELYRDAAIAAARAVLALPDTLASDLKRLGARIEPARALANGDGVAERLDAAENPGHWSRLIVTDADAPDVDCPPECYAASCKSPVPADVLRRMIEQARICDPAGPPPAATPAPEREHGGDTPAAPAREYPDRLKYILLSQRARAETVVQQRQPGLIEAIVRDRRNSARIDHELGHTLFQLMVPLDHKTALREQSRLLLVLDRYTANLPWEMLQVDGAALALRTPLVRQLATMRYRRAARTATGDHACIVANPSTRGYDKRFPVDIKALADLKGAEREGEAIRASLRAAGWADIAYGEPGKDALDILNLIYRRPYRVLAIASHGIFEAEGRDGRKYSGVVLSDGLLLTAMEIGQMEIVPELVFLGCCHVGAFNGMQGEPDRLAYSLGRELIEIGVRCVVAAGWAVDDDAACTFSGTFFTRMAQGDTFGNAIFAARRTTAERHPATNTWGAYQAYGDPGYRLRPPDEDTRKAATPAAYVAPEELLAALQRRCIANAERRDGKNAPVFASEAQWIERQLAQCPPEWAQRADVLQAVGRLYAGLGTAGFADARRHYLQAIQIEDSSHRVAVHTIEQLANLEARHGEKLANEDKAREGLELIDRAIQRLQALNAAVGNGTATAVNPERATIQGSAFKLKAAALAQAGGEPATIIESLREAARHYRASLGDDPAAKPYPTMNWLQLAWLTGTLEMSDAEAAELAQRCGASAARKFQEEKSFWNAVMGADAAMTAWLITGRTPNDEQDPASYLDQCYRAAVKSLPQSGREWDSVRKQWRVLALFLRNTSLQTRAKRSDRPTRDEVLDDLLKRHEPSAMTARQADAADASGLSAAPAETPRSTRRVRVRPAAKTLAKPAARQRKKIPS